MKHYLVKDWMRTKVITAGPKMGMLEAHRLMQRNNIRRLPIIRSNGKLVGIVTEHDFIKVASRLLEVQLLPSE